MQDLTFGEQVKIILSRKDMTIKELAKKIEARTGRKMSRQNLTQRLGRDNFQEKDMRMIAEILGCPFQLNILDERVLTENETETGHKAEAIPAGAGQTPEKELAEAASGKETLENASEEIATKAEGNVKAHERDITIGELVHIHEELDALMEKNTGKLPVGEKHEAQQDGNHKNHKDEGGVQKEVTQKEAEKVNNEGQKQDNSTAFAEENSGGHVPEGITEHTKEDIKGNLTGYPEGTVKGSKSDYSEEYPEDKWTGYSEGERTLAERPDGYQEGIPNDISTAYTEGTGGEHVEELLQEIESLEKTEKKETVQEEKPHGWRAYLKQRFKKLGREQMHTEKEANDTGRESSEGTQEVRASESVGLEGSNPEAEYPQREYENYNSEAGYPVEAYGEEGQSEDYSARAYVGGCTETEYSDGGYEEEYFTAGYSEEAYQEDILQEDEEDRGEINPYTGKEYESNSVRMHPSRIGYVQVYDRTNHEWTDMTEWAFLGYQERKKQLLGKDYDPPIYLD